MAANEREIAERQTPGESPITRRCFLCAGAGAVVARAVSGSPSPPFAAIARHISGVPRGGESHASSERGEAGSPRLDEPDSKTVDVRGLTAPGQSILAPFQGPDGAPVLIVRESATRFAALSLLCTHMGCPVNMPVRGILTCPCHGSQFDLEGKVLHGPAVYPLGQYTATYDAKRMTVTVNLEIPN